MMYYSVDEKIKVGDLFVIKMKNLSFATIKNFDMKAIVNGEDADYPTKIMFPNRFGKVISTENIKIRQDKEQFLILKYLGDNKCIDVASHHIINVISSDFIEQTDCLIVNSINNYNNFMKCYNEVIENPLCICLDEINKPIYCDDYYKLTLFNNLSQKEITNILNRNIKAARENLKKQMRENIEFDHKYALAENAILSLKK